VTTRTLPRAAALLALLGLMVVARPARADSYLDDWHPFQTYWSVYYEAAFPVGSMNSAWIDRQGWLGGGFDVRVGVWRRLSVGVSATWNSFDQTFANLTIARPGTTFTGSVFRQLGIFSARATAHWYFTNSTLQPYVGVGLGWAWATASEQVVDRRDTLYPSGFLVAPEVGVLVNVVPRLALTVTGRFQFTLVSWGGVTNAMWPSGQVGVAYFF
jgi:hypothetical protein